MPKTEQTIEVDRSFVEHVLAFTQAVKNQWPAKSDNVRRELPYVENAAARYLEAADAEIPEG